LVSKSGEEFNFSLSDLQEIVESFGGSVPFVPGHPDDDQPQLGFARAIELQGEHLVVSDYAEVDPTFKAIVNSGELPGVSVKLRLPGHPGNQSGKLELQHIGFLGRSRPAAERLPAASFAAGQTAVFCIHQGGAMGDIPESDNQSAEFAAREAELAAREAEFAAREVEFARRQEIEPFLEGLVRDGRLLPVDKPGLVELFAKVGLSQPLEFSAPDGGEQSQSADEFLKGFLGRLPKRVDYGGEVAGGDAEFSQPDSQPEDAAIKVRRAMEAKYRRAKSA
jgi:hypothetical protein